ncbi:glycosyl hydrolase family 18 protein [Ferroacidibacillus organovorans]|uniref:GH18 domain-containing protein n=1 Tax=Ferroacidibacillus organovorans TaxID=1765683 RepID=A0A124IVQ6_9BACL|nr:glycosyl hydrolase family 18 protein [Ferroacidibacillus organovorans]KUO94985.1 hypothetical protein ATW55_04950 [Ferroacidibacillus organovorans]
MNDKLVYRLSGVITLTLLLAVSSSSRAYPLVESARALPARPLELTGRQMQKAIVPPPAPQSVTYALITSRLQNAPAVQTNTLVSVTATTAQTFTFQNAGQTVTEPLTDARLFTVMTGTRQPVKKFNGEIVLGFDDPYSLTDTGSAGYPISVYAPMVYNVTSQNGAVSDQLSTQAVQIAHAHGEQVWPIVDSGFNPARTTALLESPTAQANLLSAILSDVTRDHVDGINLDFEDMIPSDAPRLTQLTENLATLLHAMGKTISVDVSVPSSDPNWGLVYNRPALAAIADNLVVMTYDEYYAGDAFSGPVAGIPWMMQELQKTAQEGVPKAKILAGIPFYTRLWSGTPGNFSSVALSLPQEASIQDSHPASLRNDPNSGMTVDTFHAGTTTQWMWLETTSTLQKRAALATAAGYGGVAVWQLGLGNASDVSAILSGVGG